MLLWISILIKIKEIETNKKNFNKDRMEFKMKRRIKTIIIG